MACKLKWQGLKSFYYTILDSGDRDLMPFKFGDDLSFNLLEGVISCWCKIRDVEMFQNIPWKNWASIQGAMRRLTTKSREVSF